MKSFMASFIDKTKNWILKHKLFLICIIVLVMIKVVWVAWACWNEGNLDKEKTDILQRRNWLIGKVVVEPRQLLNEMPRIGTAISRRMGIVFLLYAFKSSF